MSTAARIAAALERHIRSGEWGAGTRVPTEHALMVQYGCARMTVHTALAGLAARGLITRRRRAGSFVAAAPVEQAVLTIGDFAAEAAAAERAYRHEIVSFAVVDGSGADGFAAGEALISVGCRHLFDGVPVAFEARLIRVAGVPGVVEADFAAEAPGAWLLRHVPWSVAEHEITARGADAVEAGRLAIAPGAAMLCLHRRTWHDGAIVTDVRLHFAGERYRFTGRFTPG